MNTRLRKSVEEAKESVRDALIVPGEPATQETDEWAAMTWREAGAISFVFAALGLAIFGLHYLAYGRGEGQPPREVLAIGFSTVTATFGGRMKTWKVRGRFLAGLASAMAIIGLFFRFVIHDLIAFSPVHIAALVAILILFWLGIDAFAWGKRRRG